MVAKIAILPRFSLTHKHLFEKHFQKIYVKIRKLIKAWFPYQRIKTRTESWLIWKYLEALYLI